MAIELHIQTITGRCQDKEEPSTAWKFNSDDYTLRELSQFYLYLKNIVRYIESIIDDDIEEFDDTDNGRQI